MQKCSVSYVHVYVSSVTVTGTTTGDESTAESAVVDVRGHSKSTSDPCSPSAAVGMVSIRVM